MRTRPKARIPAAVLAPCALLLCVNSAAAQEAAGAAAEAAPTGVPYQTSLIILVTTGIFLIGIALTRTLLRLRAIKSMLWLMPVLVIVTGAVWLEMAIVRHQGVEKLYTLVQFIFTFLIFVTVLYGIARMVLPLEEQRTRGGVPPLIRNIAVLVLALLGLFVLLMWFFPEMPLTPVFLTSGVLSVVVGLSVQNLLSNLLAGIVLSVQRPFKIADWVEIAETEGEVAEINWRATVIRTRQNDHVTIPNAEIMKAKLINFDQPSPLHMRRVHVGVTYETPPGLAIAALMEAAERVEGVLKSPTPEIHFHNYENSSLLYELRVWIDNYASMPVIESDVRREVWYAFKRHGITIPFPQRDVNFRRIIEPTRERRGRLVAQAGLPHGTTFELDEDRITLGRDPENDICLNNPRISNEHAVIEREGEDLIIRDLDSRHGTLVNGRKITALYLQQGDEICLGPVTLVYESNLAPAAKRSYQRPVRRAKSRQPQDDSKEETKA